jgi:hypothetical protein
MDRTRASQVRCAVDRRRRPERTPLYRVVQGHFETFLALVREGHCDAEAVTAYAEREFGRLPHARNSRPWLLTKGEAALGGDGDSSQSGHCDFGAVNDWPPLGCAIVISQCLFDRIPSRTL